MWTLHRLLASAVLLLCSLHVYGQGTWQAVENLRPGTPISVNRVQCVFHRATASELICGIPWQRDFPNLHEIRFERFRIRQVCLEHSEAVNKAVGGTIGAGVGAAIGARRGSGTLNRRGGILLLGGIGALTGASFGRDFPVLHGSVIYEK